jgi:putative ATP-dependent endonuclease of the OLD family
MKLENVAIKRFRSVKEAELINCGGFNVLIGKNNAGKSSVLSAINAFFSCLKNGKIITLNPDYSKEINFFDQIIDCPIEIILTFSLTSSENDSLVADIVLEAPQMKNAVDGINSSLRLCVELFVMPQPSCFSYVKRISMAEAEIISSNSDRILLDIGESAAQELHNKFLRSCQEQENADILLSIDSDELKFIRSEVRERTPLQYLLRRVPSIALRERVTKLLVDNKIGDNLSIEDLKNEMKTLIVNSHEESRLIQNQPLTNKINTFSGEESSIPKYINNLLEKVGKMNVMYLTETRKQIGREEAERLLELKVKRGGDRTLKNIQGTVASLLGVHIDAFDSSSTALNSQQSAEMDVDNFLVEVNGSGIKEALRLVLDVEFGHPDILLVEEPEIHLHPAIETSMMRYLKRISCNSQVFITTHSTNFLDTAEMNNVYLITKSGSTDIQQLDIGEAEARIPQELGIRLSSLFMFDRLVFVEGISDEDAIREWASTLGVNLGQANVGFIHMGGVRNFAYFATESTLHFLAKRQVKMWFLIDRDEKDESEIIKMQKMLGENAKLQVLNKREIENYLISPKSIIKFIEYKNNAVGKQGNTLPAEAEISANIEECAESLKQFAIKKRMIKLTLKPIYPDIKSILEDDGESTVEKATESIQKIIDQLELEKENLENIYKEKSNEIEKSWKNSKTDIIPGDLLLDKVCQIYNVRFKKEKDTSMLASLMDKDEISSEIKKIIQEIVKT